MARSVMSDERLLGNVGDSKTLLSIAQDALKTAGDPVSLTSPSMSPVPERCRLYPYGWSVWHSAGPILVCYSQQAQAQAPTLLRLFTLLLLIVLLVDPSTLIWDCRDAGWLNG